MKDRSGFAKTSFKLSLLLLIYLIGVGPAVWIYNNSDAADDLIEFMYVPLACGLQKLDGPFEIIDDVFDERFNDLQDHNN